MSANVVPVKVVGGAGAFRIQKPLGRYRQSAAATQIRSPSVLAVYEHALCSAWQQVIDRIVDETRRAGAHGVVGVTRSQRWTGGDPEVFHPRLVGTAVRVLGAEELEQPFLSILSMADFLALILGGWVPCGLGWGVAALFVPRKGAWPARASLARFRSTELDFQTSAVQLARSRIEEQVRRTLTQTGGTGTVGLDLRVRRYVPYGALVSASMQGVMVVAEAFGTAVVRYREPLQPARMVLPLQGDR